MPLNQSSIINLQFNKSYSKMKCNERKNPDEINKKENDSNHLTDPTKLTKKDCRIKNLVINYNYW